MSLIDKISPDIVRKVECGQFNEIHDRIKLKIKNYHKDADARQAIANVQNRLLGMGVKFTPVAYGGRVKFLKIEASSFEELLKIASYEEIHFVSLVVC